MGTRIRLHHVGEVVLAGLLERLQGRDGLDVPCVAHPGCTFRRVLAAGGIAPPFRFVCDAPLAPVLIDGDEFAFDGAHRVDVLAQGAGSAALAIEAKLGLDRLGSSEFTRRFLGAVSISSHREQRRIKGSMTAILDSRVLRDVGEFELRVLADALSEVCAPWVLVLRRLVWKRWCTTKKYPPFSPLAHIVVFEDVVDHHGDGALFDDLVRELVGDGFFDNWLVRDARAARSGAR